MTERGFHPFAVLHFLRKTILLYLLPLLQVLFARNWAALRTALVQGAALLLGGMLAALALFYLFKGLDLGCVRWVNALAGTTLGVYILHQVPAFRGFLWNGLLQAEAHHGSVGYTLLAILAVFLGCRKNHSG